MHGKLSMILPAGRGNRKGYVIMREIYYLLKRNMSLFLRDYMAVFFSLLSMLIVLALMVIFLGSMNSENVVDALKKMGGARDAAADEKNAEYLIQMWTLAGILVVNTVTVTLTVMGVMVEDETGNRLASFYVAPVKRIKLALGYVFSSWIIGVGMCLVTLLVGEAYMVWKGHPLLPAVSLLKLAGMIALNAFVYASLAYLLALLVHSESAWNGLLTIMGTLVGFVGAIYLPMSMLPAGVAKTLKCLPVLHGAAMMRTICIQDALQKTFSGLPDRAADVFREQMGVTIIMDGKEVSFWGQATFLAICGIMAITASAVISGRRRLRDR